MKIGELKRELEKFDDKADVFFETNAMDYPAAKIDMRHFDKEDGFKDFNLVFIREES